MATIPVWLRGRDCAVTITPQTVGATGILTPGTTVSLVGQLESIDVEADPEMEEISPMDSTHQHHEVIKDNFTFVLVELLKRGAGVTNILASQYGSADVFIIVCTRGGQTYTFCGRRASYSERMVAGKSLATLRVQQVAFSPLSANPVYA